MIYTKLKEWLPHDLYVEYVDIIKASPKTEHTEKHHILPRSLFPEFEHEPENLVELDIMKHLMSHRTLAKTNDPKMILAFFMMFTYEHKRYSSLSEQEQQFILEEKTKARKAMRIVKKEQMKGKHDGKNNPFYGKNHTDEFRKRIGAVHKGKKLSPEHIASLVAAHKGKKREKVQCPHCGIMCAANTAKRWHFDNCKSGRVQQGD
ncbi:putative mobile endonuclease [Cronobacter phage vB_CsaD_Banach]|nr:putative mobile endonuclease [Cronobacter phage vB_CsaD_Banach]